VAWKARATEVLREQLPPAPQRSVQYARPQPTEAAAPAASWADLSPAPDAERARDNGAAAGTSSAAAAQQVAAAAQPQPAAERASRSVSSAAAQITSEPHAVAATNGSVAAADAPITSDLPSATVDGSAAAAYSERLAAAATNGAVAAAGPSTSEANDAPRNGAQPTASSSQPPPRVPPSAEARRALPTQLPAPPPAADEEEEEEGGYRVLSDSQTNAALVRLDLSALQALYMISVTDSDYEHTFQFNASYDPQVQENVVPVLESLDDARALTQLLCNKPGLRAADGVAVGIRIVSLEEARTYESLPSARSAASRTLLCLRPGFWRAAKLRLSTEVAEVCTLIAGARAAAMIEAQMDK